MIEFYGKKPSVVVKLDLFMSLSGKNDGNKMIETLGRIT